MSAADHTFAWGIPLSADTAVALQAALDAYAAGDTVPLDHIRRELFAAIMKAGDAAWHDEERQRCQAAGRPRGFFGAAGLDEARIPVTYFGAEGMLNSLRIAAPEPVARAYRANLPGLAPDPAAVAALDTMLRRWTHPNWST